MDLHKLEQQVQDQITAYQTPHENSPLFTFFDGPPFATGKPHYGHILAGTIKDTICRYKTMNGFHVPRQFGWDCHGLPVECEVDKTLGIKSKAEITDMKEYNAKCRSIVMKCEDDWEEIVKKTGRYVDNFRASYKTMDFSYMNTVWSVFKQLYEKHLIYEGVKVMPYSTATGTALSNFEAGLNYKDTQDTAVMVAFKLETYYDKPVDEDIYLVAWTTTPWTLLSNVALCVSETAEYVKCEYQTKDKNQPMKIIVSKQCAERKKWKQIGDPFPGLSLVLYKYTPIFPFASEKNEKRRRPFNLFRVLIDPFVTINDNDKNGTGVVHLAPAFGEDDYNVCEKNNIIYRYETDSIFCPVDENGLFTSEVGEQFIGRYVKDKQVEKDILAVLKERVLLIETTSHTHSYPFCYRTNTPLIYKTVSSWFVRVQDHFLKPCLLENNQKINWTPEHVKEKRFHQWLENARDWSVSRSRFWGTPLPIWVSKDGEEIVVIGSAEELQKRANLPVPLTDLHRDTIDHITIPSSRQNQSPLRRIPDVFDCWFESGCMPVVRGVDKNGHFTPADFVAEGIDQTRGWFYTTLVITSALYNSPPFKNVICNGHILAADGKKMSKSLKNYPDPMDIITKYGADALRLYLLSSPAVKGEAIKFQEAGVHEMARTILIPLHHALQFYKQAIALMNINLSRACMENNFMDQWITNYVNHVANQVAASLHNYQLSQPIHEIRTFVERLNNIYIRMNRTKIKQGNTHILRDTLVMMSKILAPFAPFYAQYLYSELQTQSKSHPQSVHTTLFPKNLALTTDEIDTIQMMEICYEIMELIRNERTKMKRPLRSPLKKVTIAYNNPQLLAMIAENMLEPLQEELNIYEICFEYNPHLYIRDVYTLQHANISKRIGSDMKSVLDEVSKLSPLSRSMFPIQIHNYVLYETDFKHTYELITEKDPSQDFTTTPCMNIRCSSMYQKPLVLVTDPEITPQILCDTIVREIIRKINDARKEAGIREQDHADVVIYYNMNYKEGPSLYSITEEIKEKIKNSGKTGKGRLNFIMNEIEKEQEIQIMIHV